jgi:Family of unknown function (DUF6107)
VIRPAELMLMGSAAASLGAWWALGPVMRAFEHGGTLLPRWIDERKDHDER